MRLMDVVSVVGQLMKHMHKYGHDHVPPTITHTHTHTFFSRNKNRMLFPWYSMTIQAIRPLDFPMDPNTTVNFAFHFGISLNQWILLSEWQHQRQRHDIFWSDFHQRFFLFHKRVRLYVCVCVCPFFIIFLLFTTSNCVSSQHRENAKVFNTKLKTLIHCLILSLGYRLLNSKVKLMLSEAKEVLINP